MQLIQLAALYIFLHLIVVGAQNWPGFNEGDGNQKHWKFFGQFWAEQKRKQLFTVSSSESVPERLFVEQKRKFYDFRNLIV